MPTARRPSAKKQKASTKKASKKATKTPSKTPCVAYSLFAVEDKQGQYVLGTQYAIGFARTVKSIRRHLPGWEMVVFYDDTLAKSDLGKLVLEHARRHRVQMHKFDYGDAKPYVKAGARFEALQMSSRFSVVALRDVDSPITALDARHLKKFAADDDAARLGYIPFEVCTVPRKVLVAHGLADVIKDLQAPRSECDPKSKKLILTDSGMTMGGGNAVNLRLFGKVKKYADFIAKKKAGRSKDARGYDELYLSDIFEKLEKRGGKTIEVETTMLNSGAYVELIDGKPLVSAPAQSVTPAGAARALKQ